MYPAITDQERATARSAFGTELDALIEKYRLAGALHPADLTAALEGRADRQRQVVAARQQADRARLRRHVADEREKAVASLALRLQLPVETVSLMLRGDTTNFESRRPGVLTAAAEYPALRDELAALQQAEEQRGVPERVPSPVAVGPVVAKAAPQPITIGGK